MTEHTPTPWFIEASDGKMDAAAKFETGSRVLIFSEDCPYHPIADCSCNHTCRMPYEQEDNAAFIVRAVNNHIPLVEAMEICRDTLEACSHVYPDDLGIAKALSAARAVLAVTSTVSAAVSEGK